MTITSSPHLAPDDVARHTFASVRRGFDPNEVRDFLESIAFGLRGVADRERQLLQELADAEHRAANPVLDEPTLTSALGQETARVLHSAHEVAAEMVAKAEAEANRLLTEANEETEQNRARAEARTAEQTARAEAEINDLRQRTDQQVSGALESARHETEEVLAQAREECRAMVDEAQQLRARVLADLSRRRKILHAQIEQLRAGRERLAETINDVRRSVDVIADDLFTAEDDARLAAEAAGREAVSRPDEGTPEELAAVLLADEAEVAADLAPSDGTAVDARSGEEEASAAGDLVEAGDGGATAATEALPAEAPLAEVPPAKSVDALFAKIRAAREEPGDDDQPHAPGGEAAGAVEPGPEPEGAGPEGAGEGPGDEPPEERNPLAVRRDELVSPIITALARRLKRTLQDNQNDLLDRLRSNGSHWSIDLLPEETEHIDSYATAALPALEQASEAGASFAGTGPSHGPHADVLLGVAHDLSESVVGPLRRRLADGDGLDDAEESVVAEYVGSAFREWKGERIVRLAGDHVVAAFSLGTISVIEGEKSAQLEWVAVSGTGDAPCPDCEDNGLNGSQRPGEA
ncbi:MAG TPA: DivIVA domain-containing protein, partial [Acidimicrobiales bacterium]|nr:DivIVA domain-containing protein [Acidimicrobiales bacterium]